MRFGGRRTSGNVENRRGAGGGFAFPGGGGGGLAFGGRSIGCGGLLLIIVVSLLFGINPLALVDGGGGSGGIAPHERRQQGATRGGAAIEGEQDRFLSQVLASTEDRWGELFRQAGMRYPAPAMVFYDRTDRSGCGVAQAAMGPFYCPADQGIYIDTRFFDELSRRYGAPGDFAQAYVIAHEVGHHVQTLDGTAERVRRAQRRVGRAAGNALQVGMELQADCYAGVWAAMERDYLEPGDLQEGMRAAAAIGDDTLQRSTQGRVVPESFTHGTSQQRMDALMRGYRGGSPEACAAYTQAG